MGRVKTFVREDVLDSAIQVFWEKGFADTSLSDLEKATGVNKSGLYSEFKDKEDIYSECLKRYRDTNPVIDILDAAPHGWHNIEKFITSRMTCKGKKGCFLSNSIREYAIIPQEARKAMEVASTTVAELVKKNLKAAGVKKNLDPLTNMIITFSTGLALKLNAMSPTELKPEIEHFFEMIKRS